ncbi:MAG TPA: serine hydrolase domain-containing protein [Sphingomicrobium sp.]|nr:serine hydrolase domain-containing protein [Sphingomicrobium sp.]
MRTSYKVAIGAGALLLGSALVATRPSADNANRAQLAGASLRLAAVDPAARQSVDYQALDSRLQRLMQRPNMVGLAVGIVENGRITFLKGYGETLSGSGEPVTPETVFRWASVSKGVASTMVAKLAEQGKVDLSAPVAKYSKTLKLPGGAEHRATVSDLLSHRVGLYRNAYDNKLEEGGDPRLLRMQLAQLNLICQPGTCWSYGNVAYDATSEIVERETRQPYEIALRQNLFDPLGMSSASASREGLTGSKSWARPHNAGRREIELTDTYYRVPAAGGVNSNIKDLAVWMLAQMGQMPQVISPNVLGAIHAPLVKTPGERGRLRKFLERLGTAWYGYGWRSYDYAGHRIVGHRGGVNGYRSLILFDPEKKSGVVALWNSSTSQPGGLEFEVMDMLYGLPFRDWLEIDKSGAPVRIAEDQQANDTGNGSR